LKLENIEIEQLIEEQRSDWPGALFRLNHPMDF
jgi:hypothetical protein